MTLKKLERREEMKLGTRILVLLTSVVISVGIFGLIASGLTIDRIMLAARPVVEVFSVFSQILG
jgi:hypothetical protein